MVRIWFRLRFKVWLGFRVNFRVRIILRAKFMASARTEVVTRVRASFRFMLRVRLVLD